MEIAANETILKADQAVPENAELPPKKRIVHKAREVCNRPEETNNCKTNSIPTVLEQTQNIDSQNQQKLSRDQESQKLDPQPEIIVETNLVPIVLEQTQTTDSQNQQNPSLPDPQPEMIVEINSIPTVLERTQNIDSQNQQNPSLYQESKKLDPQPEVIMLDNDESESFLYPNEGLLNEGKKVSIEPLELMYLKHAQNADSQDRQKIRLGHDSTKADPKPEVIVIDEDESEPSFSEYLNENRNGESSEVSDLIRRPIECRFCGQRFPSTQALGGHQNAHKKERDMQKAMKAVKEFHNNPFMYSLPGILSPAFRGTPTGRRFQYHPYDRYNHTSLQERPVYSPPGKGLPLGGPSGLGREAERVTGSSYVRPVGTAVDPRWSSTYPTSLGPIRISNGPTNFHPPAGSNWMAFTKARENEASLARRQQVESPGLGLSLVRKEPVTLSFFPERGGSTKLDLDLKL